MNKILIEPFIQTLPKPYKAIPQSLFHSFKPIVSTSTLMAPLF